MSRTDIKGWTDIGSDRGWEDYGGRWAKKLRPGAYLVLRFENMEEVLGEREFTRGGIDRYSCDVLCVDLPAVAMSGALADALRACGWTTRVQANGELLIENEYDGATVAEGRTVSELAMVDACVGYGAMAPLHTETGNGHPLRVRGRARHFAETLIREEPASRVDALMERPVNAIGSTAREYMTGDIYSAMRRGKGDPTVDLVRKMYGACEVTLDGTPIPADIREER